MKRLLLMSGIHHPEGWTTLDANPANKPDILATIPPLPPNKVFQYAKWDHIEWIHGITSLYPWAAETVLKEICYSLSRRGLLVLEQPNYLMCTTNLQWVFGDPEPCDPLHMNKWAYTPRQLKELVTFCGFTRVEILPAQHHNPARDFRLEARP
jgi:hypothetical protein